MRTLKKSRVSDSYLKMIRQFPLRPIRNDAECEEATKLLDKYFPRDDLDGGWESVRITPCGHWHG